ncbi:unnamed protein product [Camellia sinensis]
MAPTISFILLTIQIYILTSTKPCNGSTLVTKFSTLLIFGDSTVDTGNNNYIKSLMKSNHRPYGQDFPGQVATGRFSNGKLVPDFVATMLGIKDIVPPYLDPSLSDEELRTGVSFASAGSGYDDVTSDVTLSIPVSKQPGYLRSYVERLKESLGEKEAMNITNGALVIVSAGTNDFVFNFYDIPTRRITFNISEYHDFVLNNLQKFVQELYKIGCRTMVVAGLPPIGCIPIQMTAKLQIHRKCIDHQNSDAQSYNAKLSNLLPQLQSSLPGSKIIYADIYTPLDDMMKNPQKYGLNETRKGCCGSGLIEAAFLCSPITPVCHSASNHLFWDSVHPSESGYNHLSQSLAAAIIGQLF